MPDRPLLHLRLTGAAERHLRHGHPWVYHNRIQQTDGSGCAGDWAVIYDRNDRFLAIGLFDPDSPIRVRIVHQGKARKLDPAFWSEKIAQAKALRVGILDDQTTACRWIYGESDGWPGMVVDGYGDTLVLKLYSRSWLVHLGWIREQLLTAFQPKRIVLRLSRLVQSQIQDDRCSDGTLLFGSPPEGPVRFRESGLLFEADVLAGQKTGFFLDQRDNRRWMQTLSKGRSVLNCFSFSGAFSLYAAAGGADAVTSVDRDPHALNSCQNHWKLNSNLAPVARAHHRTVQADVFSWLPRQEETYQLVIVDPPSLAPRKSDRERALQAYRHLAAAALDRTAPGGHCLLCSCSAHVTAEDLTAVLQTVTRREARVVDRSGHAPDHPVGIPEMNYLKAFLLEKRAGGSTSR